MALPLKQLVKFTFQQPYILDCSERYVSWQGAIAFSGYQYSTSSEAFLGAVKQVWKFLKGCCMAYLLQNCPASGWMSPIFSIQSLLPIHLSLCVKLSLFLGVLLLARKVCHTEMIWHCAASSLKWEENPSFLLTKRLEYMASFAAGWSIIQWTECLREDKGSCQHG